MYATLDEWQIFLLRRLRHADYAKPAELHDFATLMGEDLRRLPDRWLDETFHAFQAFELIDPMSGKTFAGYHGRLAPRARWLLDDLDDDAA
jgi:hypothetical protein